MIKGVTPSDGASLRFTLPTWLRDELERGRGGPVESRIWALFVLLRWCREHEVKL